MVKASHNTTPGPSRPAAASSTQLVPLADETIRDFHLKLVSQVQRVIRGVVAQTPSPSVVRFETVGLLFFLNEKQAQLHNALRGVDLSVDESLTPLKLLVEFMTFVVGGLIVEAEKVDEEVIRTKQSVNEWQAELEALNVELQYRRQHVGSAVTRVLSQHYRTKVRVPVAHPSDQLDPLSAEGLQDVVAAIAKARREHEAAKKRLRALLHAQHVLHGTNPHVAPVESNAIVGALGIAHTFCKANHKLRDAMIPFESPVDDLPTLVSLQEFVLHVDIGMTAANDDLDAAIISLRRHLVYQHKERQHERLRMKDERNKQLSTSAITYNERVGRDALGGNRPNTLAVTDKDTAASQPNHQRHDSEMDDFFRLYCS
jgi:hypothetical protein